MRRQTTRGGRDAGTPGTPSSRWRHATAFATLTLGLLLLLVTAMSLQSSIANAYVGLGFLRTPVFLLGDALGKLWLPVAAASVLLWATVLAIASRGVRGGLAFQLAFQLAFRRTLPVFAALTVFLRLGYVENRYGLSAYWIHRREMFGLELPIALTAWEVWRANLLVLAKAIAAGILVWLLLRVLLGPGARRTAHLWRALGHPAWLGVALILTAAVPLAGRALRAEGRPNIILISIDTLRADHLSTYGYHLETSPALDALAAGGILFENCVSPAPNTPPAHMSIFTSLYPTVHGFTGEGDRLAGWRLTLTEYLREAGYRTAATTDGGYMRGWFGFGQGFERYADRYKGIAASRDLVLEWLDAGLASSPFFLFMHNYDVHSPYNPPPPYRTMFTDPAYDGDFFPGSQELERIRKRINTDSTATHGLSPGDVAHMIARYDGGIRYTDTIIGELVAALDARGLLESTWIFVTSDHGEELTEHGSVLHEKLYRTVTHVPLIVHPPGAPRAHRRVPEVVELTDLMPTLLELAGLTAALEQPLAGTSLVPFLEGDVPVAWKNVAFSEHPWRGRRRAITRPDLHVLTSLDRRELEAYAYLEDPLEQHDLAPRHTRVADGTAAALDSAAGAPLDTLRAAIRALFGWTENQATIAASTRGGTEGVALDEQAIEELRALGYLQ